MKAEEPIVKDSRDDDFTCITFEPDLKKFKMDKLDDDTIALLARRAYDIAASTPGVKVFLNDKKLPVNKFEDYCKLYLNNNPESDEPVKLIYEKVFTKIYNFNFDWNGKRPFFLLILLSIQESITFCTLLFDFYA